MVPITVVTGEGSSGDLAIGCAINLFTLENVAFYVRGLSHNFAIDIFMAIDNLKIHHNSFKMRRSSFYFGAHREVEHDGTVDMGIKWDEDSDERLNSNEENESVTLDNSVALDVIYQVNDNEISQVPRDVQYDIPIEKSKTTLETPHPVKREKEVKCWKNGTRV
nr:hypothetical protein [Tanacetum cinerariifolium]